MIFLPKAFERYASALRLSVQLSVLRGGNDARHLRRLKKICFAEALYRRDERSPEDIRRLSDSVLGAALIILMGRGGLPAVELSGGGTYLVNRRLYVALLTELAAKSRNIRVNAGEKGVIITAVGFYGSAALAKMVRAMGGVILRERNADRSVIFIPAEKTRIKADRVENEWCYLLDPFSPVNIWLLNVRGDSAPK